LADEFALATTPDPLAFSPVTAFQKLWKLS
jgi:hypothetical protein